MRHRCVSAQPLPIPLPYPRIFSPLVLQQGDIFRPPPPRLTANLNGGVPPPWQNPVPVQQQSNAPHMNGHVEVESLPVLTRLMASQEAAALASQQLDSFAGGSLPGCAGEVKGHE